MALAHNLILRGLNAIYNQAPWVKPADAKSFLYFIDTWHALVDAHHAGEEDEFFPWIDETTGVPGLMDTNREQHTAFHGGVEDLKAYTTQCIEGKETFDGAKVVRLIDSFGTVFQEHLAAEIPNLMALEKYADKLENIKKEMMKRAEKGMVSGEQSWLENYAAANPAKQDMGMGRVSVALHVHDVTWENGRWSDFPPVGWFLTFVLRNIFARIHSDWWKFAPCDVYGRPKPQQYAGPPA